MSTANALLIIGFVAGLLIACVTTRPATAAVTGPCSNCHTMHNSQAGSSVSQTTLPTLLGKDCVGCHSSDTPETILELNGSRIPVVFNTSGYPPRPLAGGNFYHVARAGGGLDTHGHNVLGVSDRDSILSRAPGSSQPQCNGCHVSLALELSEYTPGPGTPKKAGCQGCHQNVRHHGQAPAPGSPATGASGWYRFLGGHTNPAMDYVTGIEDPNWEHDPEAGHNFYSGTNNWYTEGNGLGQVKTISAFCSGCHRDFHSLNGGASNNMESPWLRHPTDKSLPTTGEYGGYDPIGNYNPEVPVGWIHPATPARAEAVVICLSCHRAHGSPYPSMLRWDYSGMKANSADSAAGTGCFVCHTTKDDIF